MTDTPSARPPSAPRGLGTRGRRFWRWAVREFDIGRAERELLAEVCRVLDTVDALQGQIAEDGDVVGGKPHPAHVELRQQRLALGRLLAQLDIPDEAIDSPTTTRARKAARSRWDGHVRRKDA